MSYEDLEARVEKLEEEINKRPKMWEIALAALCFFIGVAIANHFWP